MLASALGAKPPSRVPRWLGRLAGGEAATVMMTEARGASNAKAKRELGWEPRYASWRPSDNRGGVAQDCPTHEPTKLERRRRRTLTKLW